MGKRGNKQRRILAVASGGGHWIQLLRLRPAFEGHETVYLTTEEAHRGDIGAARFHVMRDANKDSKVALMLCALKVLLVVVRERPDVIVSTGAAPGYIAIRLGSVLGARTIWIDSVANAERLSLSGRLATGAADLCLTQWKHLADDRISYAGAVL